MTQLAPPPPSAPRRDWPAIWILGGGAAVVVALIMWRATWGLAIKWLGVPAFTDLPRHIKLILHHGWSVYAVQGLAWPAAVHWGLIVIPALLAGVAAARLVWRPSIGAPLHVRGLMYEADPDRAAVLAARQAKAEVKREAGRRGLTIHPKITLSLDRDARGILAVGAAGSGKTQFLLPLLLQILQEGHRALIFDRKGEFTSKLPVQSARLLAPWDRRSARWDIAQDVRTRADARLVASLFVQESKDPMWSHAARSILSGLMVALATQRPGRWGFSELAQALQLPDERVAQILSQHAPESARTMQALAGKSKTAQGIMITLESYMAAIFDLARAEADSLQAPRFSVQRWLKSDNEPRVVILQGSERHELMARALASSITSLAIAHISDPSFPEVRARSGADWRTYFVLDEFPQLGKLEAVETLISVCRAKGARAILGIQDIGQVIQIYGKEIADTWFSQLSVKFVGNTAPGNTAQWLSDMLGDEELDMPQRSLSAGGQGGATTSLSWQRTSRRVIQPAQFSTDLSASPAGVVGLLQVSGWPGVYRLRWPITPLPTLREGVVPAAWTRAPAPPPRRPAEQPPAAPPATGGMEIDNSSTAQPIVHTQPLEQPAPQCSAVEMPQPVQPIQPMEADPAEGASADPPREREESPWGELVQHEIKGHAIEAATAAVGLDHGAALAVELTDEVLHEIAESWTVGPAVQVPPPAPAEGPRKRRFRRRAVEAQDERED